MSIEYIDSKKQWSPVDVDKIEFDIPSPCSVAWEDMKGDEKSRLCSQCNHHVYNFSIMPSEDIADVLNLNQEKVCIRLYKRKDGKVINANDCNITLKNIKKAFKTGGLMAVYLFISMAVLMLIYIFLDDDKDGNGRRRHSVGKMAPERTNKHQDQIK